MAVGIDSVLSGVLSNIKLVKKSRPRRVRDQLADPRTIRTLLRGWTIAGEVGLELNMAVTIHYGLANGVGDWEAKHRRVRRALDRWLPTITDKAIYAGVIEATSIPVKEFHTHLAIHLPEGPYGRPSGFHLDQLRRLIERHVGDEKGVIDIQVCRDNVHGPEGWMLYLIKSAPPSMIRRRKKDPGSKLWLPVDLQKKAVPEIGQLRKRLFSTRALARLAYGVMPIAEKQSKEIKRVVSSISS